DRNRHRDEEDDEKHQHHVHERRGVDLRHRPFVAAASRRNRHDYILSNLSISEVMPGRPKPAQHHGYQRFVVVVVVVPVAGAVAAALPACWVDAALVSTAGFTAPLELMFARMSVEKPESSSAIRLLRLCSQL